MVNGKKEFDFKLFLLLGVITRFVIAPFTAYEFDVGVLKFAARSYYEHGNVTLFSEWTSPPLLYYLVLFSYSFYYLLHYKVGFPDFYLFAHSIGVIEGVFLKLPFIIADILSFLILYKSFSLVGLEKKKRLSLSNTYFLSPFTIFISSAWGMWDPLAAFFLILGTYFFIKAKKQHNEYYEYYAIFSFVASFGVKWVGLAPLFIFLSMLLAKRAYSKFMKALLLSIASIIVLYTPFFFQGRQYLLEVLVFRTTGGNAMPYTANHFQFLFYLGVSTKLIKGVFLPGYAVFCIILFIILVYLYEKEVLHEEVPNEPQVFIIFTLLMLTIFYLLYYAVNIYLTIWFMAMAPFFLSISQLGLELRERFRFYLLLYTFSAGILLTIASIDTILFGNPSFDPASATRGTTGLLATITSVFISLYFGYMSFLLCKGLYNILEMKNSNQ